MERTESAIDFLLLKQLPAPFGEASSALITSDDDDLAVFLPAASLSCYFISPHSFTSFFFCIKHWQHFLYPFACPRQDLYHQFECISRLIKTRKRV